VQLNRQRSGNQTRRLEPKQLDDGIGDTLVLIDKPNGIGNGEELETRQGYVITVTSSTHFQSIFRGTPKRSECFSAKVGNSAAKAAMISPWPAQWMTMTNLCVRQLE